MADWVWGIIVALAAIGGAVAGEGLRIWRSKIETKETRRRDAAAAALEIMKMAPIKDTERNKFVKHYGMVYEKLLKLLRAPEK